MRAYLQDVLELHAGRCELALEHDEDVRVVLLGLLALHCACTSRARGGARRQRLQFGDLAVERGDVALDDVGELRDLDGPVIEQRLALCDCANADANECKNLSISRPCAV